MKVFITRVIPSEGLSILQNAGFDVTQWTEKRDLAQRELIAYAKAHDALLSVGKNQLDAFFFKECRHLKAITLLSAGYDHVDIGTANEMGIPVGYTPDVLSNATADTALLLMLAVSRKAFYQHKRIQNGEWQFYDPTAHLGFELTGKTLGIFGLGRIGMALARKCIGAFGMKVIYHNRNRNLQAEKDLNVQFVSFNELVLQSDVLSVHANLSVETREVFNLSVFRKMKPSAIFINTARGGLHNEQELTEALKDGLIWGAGLDVTNPEPMAADNELLNMPNVCILPHIGSATKEARTAMAVMAAQNIIEGAKGLEMPHTINPQVYQR